MKIALLAGASGLVGSRLLQELARSDDYSEIHILVRRPLSLDLPKVREHVLDYEDVPLTEIDFTRVDDIYCALGTTIRKAGSKERFARVDHDYVIALGQLAKRVGTHRFLVVSSLGADPASSNFYLRVKGDMEESLRRLDLPHLMIFRPSLLRGDRGEFRLGEQVGYLALTLFSPLLPDRIKPVSDDQVAAAMIWAAGNVDEAVRIFESDEIRRLGGPIRSG